VARNIYRVIPEGALWAVQFGGSVVGRWRVKDNAVRRARSLAASDEPSMVTIHRPDGSIEREWRFGHEPSPG
jgi:hypothetical protein